MKSLNLITAVSVAALLASAPAFAGDMNTVAQNTQPQYNTPAPSGNPSNSSEMGEDLKQGWEDAKDTVRRTTDGANNTMSNPYKEIKATMINDEPQVQPFPISLDENMTAQGMIDKPVYNQSNERVAVMSDIILDHEGNAQMIILKNGDFAGLGGKLVAFNYDTIIDRTPNGDIVMPLSERSLETATEFSYEQNAEGNIRMIPANGYSVNQLLDGNLLGADGSDLANIDNISFRDGRASVVIAVFNQVFFMGGEKVAVDFNPTRIVREDDGEINIKLSQTQTEKFEKYKDMPASQRLGRAY